MLAGDGPERELLFDPVQESELPASIQLDAAVDVDAGQVESGDVDQPIPVGLASRRPVESGDVGQQLAVVFDD